MTAPSARPSPAVRRAAKILRVLSEGEASTGVSLSHLARILHCSKSSAANVCAALVEAQLIEQDQASGRFRLGRGVLELGGAYLEGSDPVRRFHTDLADLLILRLETVQLAVADGSEVVYLTRHDGEQPLRIWSSPGARLPATTTATGKALLAELHDVDIRDLLSGRELAQPTHRSISTVESLLADLAQTRERGYSVDDEESTEGLLCLGHIRQGVVCAHGVGVATTGVVRSSRRTGVGSADGRSGGRCDGAQVEVATGVRSTPPSQGVGAGS